MEKKTWVAPELETLDIANTELLPISHNSYDYTFSQNGWVGAGDYKETSAQ